MSDDAEARLTSGERLEEDTGEGTAGGQPHKVEAECRGTDQGVGHGSASNRRSPEVGQTMLTVNLR